MSASEDSVSLATLNAAAANTAAGYFERCCAAPNWIDGMVAARPYADLTSLLASADSVWAELSESDWLAAFEAHPQIGNVDSLRARFGNTRGLAAGEQSAVGSADEATLSALAAGNQQYLAQNGFIFIVCATGLSAATMLDKLRARLPHSREQELQIAAEEQRKITALRLQKLVTTV